MTFARALRPGYAWRACRLWLVASALAPAGAQLAAADAPPRIIVTAHPLALMVSEITSGITQPETLDSVRLAQLPPEAMRRSLNDPQLVVWIGRFHRPRLVPVLAGQRKISSLPLFDVRGVRLMGLPEPVKPGVKAAVPKNKIPRKSQVSRRSREISARDLHHKYPDPYIWLDPRNGIAMAKAITVRLSAIDPENGRRYRRNSAALISRIEALDQEFQVRVVPMRKIEFAALDRTFQYFERQYNLTPKLRLHNSVRAMTAAQATAARTKLVGARLRCVIIPTTAAYGATIAKGVRMRVAWIDPYGRDLPKTATYSDFLRSIADRYTACLTGSRPPTR